MRLLRTLVFLCSSILLHSQVTIQPNVSALRSTYIHGTIDIVISTRAGFVLATDSRGTNPFTGTHSDDVQKLYPVGTRAASVIAGLVGSEMGAEGFDLRDAIGSHLSRLNKLAERDSTASSTNGIIASFQHGLNGVAGLLAPGTRSSPYFVGEVSAVSMAQDGVPDWITLVIPLQMHYEHDGAYFTPGQPIYILHTLVSGLRFDIQALGVPGIAEKMLMADRPVESNEFTKTKVMGKYYKRKAHGRLDDFTIQEAVALAKNLVEATKRYANPSDGVGGPVDVLTLTKNGVQWQDRKRDVAPLPPPFNQQLFFVGFENGNQPLDGLQCVRCRFNNMRLTYDGRGDVQLLGAQFEGTCELEITPEAKQRNPQVARRLSESLGSKCHVLPSN